MMNNYQDNRPPFDSDNEPLDHQKYISLFVSNWYLFAISLFVSLCIAYGINRWSEKIYTVSSSLLIKEDPNSSLSEIFPGTENLKAKQNLSNEIGILKSFKLNSRVIEKLPEFNIVYTSVGKRGIVETRLYKRTPFIVIYDSLDKQTFNKQVNIKLLSDSLYALDINDDVNINKTLSFGERFHDGGFDFILKLRDSAEFYFNPDASNKYYFAFVSPAGLANQYRAKLSIAPIEEESSFVTLSTTGFVPQQEADYLNALMDDYLDFGLEFKNQTAAQSLEFIEKQLKTISDSLKLAETKLEKFRLKYNVIDISHEGTIIQNSLEQIDQQRSNLLMQRSYYEYLRNYIDTKNENSDIIAPAVMGITDPLLINLVNELSELQRQKRQLSMNLDESSEPVKVFETNINNVRKSLRENVLNGLENIRISINQSDEKLAAIESQVKKLPSTERQMINIQRKFDINNTVYTFLLEKRAEAGISKASNVSDNRIIDRAGYYSSAMIKPRKSRNLLIAVLTGMIIPFIGIVLLDYLNNKILDKKDIEKGTSIPIIGYISHNNLKTEMPVKEKPGSTISESFRSVRTNLKYFLRDTKCPTISVCSTITAEGKTFISSNLAAILAASGKRILLVGLDLRKPRIHKIFGISNDAGVSSYLIGEKLYEEIITETPVENLWYAPSGPVPPNPAELIESDAMSLFLKTARDQFDYIVIDTPPIGVVTDSLLISRYTDFYLFVVRQRYSSKNTLELLEELNNNKSIHNIGIVMNDISLSGYYGYGLRYGYPVGYGYNYGYNYYENYGKYGYSRSGKGYYSDEV